MMQGLTKYSVFSGMLAFAGLPIYLHAPKFFVDTYGISLTTIGLVLLALRFIDFGQDPLIGWLLDKMKSGHANIASFGGLIIGLAMLGLFAITAPISPIIWFALTMVMLFSAFSLLTIQFYSQGVIKAESLGISGHVKLATWRETGALLGVCIASVLPFVLQGSSNNPMLGFAIFFALLVAIASILMRNEWTKTKRSRASLKTIIGDKILRRLLFVGLFNAAPVAVTASLFLFFVQYRLGHETAAGPMLLLFFLSAAIAVPIWGRLARSYGLKTVLLFGMGLSVLAFVFALTLGNGELLSFAFVCIATGAALGGDMTLLPAAFARRIEDMQIAGAQAFGLWGFCAKFTLALAAAFVLPSLEFAGFTSKGTNSDSALWALTFLYAGLPCILKLIAMAILARTDLKEIGT